MTKIDDPVKSFHLTIKALYDTEKQLENTLPKMAEAATNPELAEGFKAHLEKTKAQSQRLEEIFKMLDAPAEKHAGQTIRGLIADGRAIVSADAPAELKDVMLAAAARKVEHFEMAAYTGAIEEAKAIEMAEAAELLEDTLAEEEAADKTLETALKDNLQLAK